MVDLADIFSTLGTIISFILSFTPTVPFMKVFRKEEKIDITRRSSSFFNFKSISLGFSLDINRPKNSIN